MALTVCRIPGCPTLTDTGLCPTHARERDQARGSRQQRGYNADHDRLRKAWAPRVATGTIACWRCHKLIRPTEPWDLGHDEDKQRYRGPEHVKCNRATMGRERSQ